MSFLPLPTNLNGYLTTLDPGADLVLELGSGDGRFLSRLKDAGANCLGLERRHPAAGAVCDVVGDARRVPIRPGSLSAVVAPNLVRHLSPRPDLAVWIRRWRSLLKPGGQLFVFEDDPDPTVVAQRNFRDLQRFLARLMPESRGPLLSLSRFRSLAEAGPETGWAFGHQANREAVDPKAVLSLLEGGRGDLTGAEASLGNSIRRHGVSPGRYWWAQAGALPEEAIA